jgi:tRNA pseudouridine55 synthase
MNKNSTAENCSGFLIVKKPIGPTSHDIIDQLRRITGIRKIGHAGTLDPFASGVLIVAVGREATRGISRFMKLDKKYIATLRLGAVSDTHDRIGAIVETLQCNVSTEKDFITIIERFTGKHNQIPPMFSAKKIKGKKLYELARKGIEIERAPCEIEIFEIKLMSYRWPHAKISVHCSSGTYIRSLADDIGKALGCGAYLEALERIAIGDYSIGKAADIGKLNKDNWKESLFS